MSAVEWKCSAIHRISTVDRRSHDIVRKNVTSGQYFLQTVISTMPLGQSAYLKIIVVNSADGIKPIEIWGPWCINDRILSLWRFMISWLLFFRASMDDVVLARLVWNICCCKTIQFVRSRRVTLRPLMRIVGWTRFKKNSPQWWKPCVFSSVRHRSGWKNICVFWDECL